jgi:hypothetical protein
METAEKARCDLANKGKTFSFGKKEGKNLQIISDDSGS